MSLKDNLELVQRRIAQAAHEAGRDASAIRLIAVSKEQPVEQALALYDLGVRDFGENTVQGLLEKATVFERLNKKATWHCIGRLQRNKVNQVLSAASFIHSVERLDLALAISKRAPSEGVSVLVQVNIGQEVQKGGIDPSDAVAMAREISRLPGLRLVGVMAIPPADVDPVPYFVALAEVSRQLRATPEGALASELSMGMSQDYEAAVHHGATMVRVGTAIFGERAARGAST